MVSSHTKACSSVERYGRPLAPGIQALGPSPSQYLSFEPELGGWNNLRSAFESFVVLAAIFGRTLVLPPKTVTRGGFPAPFSAGFTTTKSFADFLTVEKLASHVQVELPRPTHWHPPTLKALTDRLSRQRPSSPLKQTVREAVWPTAPHRAAFEARRYQVRRSTRFTCTCAGMASSQSGVRPRTAY